VKTTVGEYNFGNYSNPKVDELLDKGRVEFDTAKRYALFNEAMSIDGRGGRLHPARVPPCHLGDAQGRQGEDSARTTSSTCAS
jgi:hypothetical protein